MREKEKERSAILDISISPEKKIFQRHSGEIGEEEGGNGIGGHNEIG